MGLLQRILIVVALARVAAPACVDASSCSLNGDCVAGACVCDPWWAGSPACDVLAIQPARKTDGYRNASGVMSWGGMSVRDDAGAWHLFAAELINKCPLSTWKNNSRTVRGVGTAPGGPFEIVQQIAPPFSHNPKILRASDGTYVLYSIGSGLFFPTPVHCGASASSASSVGALGILSCADTNNTASQCVFDGCGPEPGCPNGGCGITVGSAPTPEGPWTFTPLNITDAHRSPLMDAQHTNPSAVFFPNGSVLVAFNAGWNHNNLETIGIAQAPSWRGPYTLFSLAPVLFNADGSPHRCEDPFLYASQRGLHLLVHNQQDSGVSRYAHSADGGASWVLHGAPGPYDGNVRWADGTADSYEVERPQFVFDPDTAAPLFLTNGASSGDLSFTLFRPLSQTPPPPPPPPARLVNANGECLATNGTVPCWTNPSGYWLCPLLVSAAACAQPTALWQVTSTGGIASAASGVALGASLNVDCATCDAGRLLKLMDGSAAPLSLVDGQIVLGACSPRMCITATGGAGASPPCSGGGEPWAPTQPHLAACSDTATQGWKWQAA